MKAWDGRRKASDFQAGRHTFSGLTAGVTDSQSFVFDPPFDNPPSVTVTAHVTDPTTADVSVLNADENGFDLHIQRTVSVGCDVSWHAAAVTQ